MGNITIILGAGASAPDGCPVMGNFWEKATDVVKSVRSEALKDEYEVVSRFRETLRRLEGRASLMTNNLEDLMGLASTGSLLNLNDMGGRINWADVLDCLRRLTSSVIEHSHECHISKFGHDIILSDGSECDPDSANRVVGPKAYDRLARMIAQAVTRNPELRFSVVSFNYDVGLEVALAKRSVSWYYWNPCPNADSTHTPHVCILKPHGSLSFYKGRDTSWSKNLVHAVGKDVRDRLMEDSSRPMLMLVSDVAGRMPEKPVGSNESPEIITPDQDKVGSGPDRLAALCACLKMIGDANLLVVAGYSLPESDSAVRRWLRLANISEVPLRRVWLCDKDPNAHDRWIAMLAPNLEFRREAIRLSDHVMDLSREIAQDLHAHDWRVDYEMLKPGPGRRVR